MMWYGTRMMGPYIGMGFYGGFSALVGFACLAILAALILSIIAIIRTSKKRVGKILLRRTSSLSALPEERSVAKSSSR